MLGFGWLRKLVAPRTRTVKVIRARYDNAQTTHDNARHWSAADVLSASAANSLAVRSMLRKRSRYEVANNGIAYGIASTLCNDVIGTGPRLQIDADREAVLPIERAFRRWADEINLADTLRTLRRSRLVDGEGFAVITSNQDLMSPVKLDVRLVECDRVTDPYIAPTSAEMWSDGIQYDANGRPTQYRVLRRHPGDASTFVSDREYDDIPARYVIHDYRADRPGQLRGVPEITATLGLFAELRRYTLAVLAAAETAADFAWFMKSTGSDSPTASADPFDTIDIERRLGQVLPQGWDISQLKAEQPTTTYGDFRRNIINEAARPLNMPIGIAAGDSSGYNYASGRLDHQTYQRAITIDREQYARKVLDRILYAWLDEAMLIPGLIPQGLGPFAAWDWSWRWDGFGHVDPTKEANAQQTRLANHTTTLRDEYASQGQDWEEQLRQRAKEVELMKSLGLPVATANVTLDTATEDVADGETQGN
jgi:lambda family phage portal protein